MKKKTTRKKADVVFGPDADPFLIAQAFIHLAQGIRSEGVDTWKLATAFMYVAAVIAADDAYSNPDPTTRAAIDAWCARFRTCMLGAKRGFASPPRRGKPAAKNTAPKRAKFGPKKQRRVR
jgi:hypothetical protein